MSGKKLENLSYQGEAVLETIPCPLCGGRDFRALVIEQTIPVVRCAGCSLVFANPRPNREGLTKFYENYFPPESESLWREQMAQVFLKEGFEKLKAFERSGIFRPGNPPKILDVGCGMGFFLDFMRRRGWKVTGVEPAPAAARHAREKLRLDVFEGNLDEASVQGPFDVVTLWYVMEHVPNPHEILDRVAGLLRSGGLVIIRVPNQNIVIDQILAAIGLGRYFLMNPPRHLFDYSPKTLSRFLEVRGFEVLEICNGIPRGTGTWLELLRRRLWYGVFQALYRLSGGKIIRGSSITVYAKKK